MSSPQSGFSFLDGLILLPVLPLLPFAAFFWLPWERLIKVEKISKGAKRCFGPYVLYASFVSWHFKQDWWITLMVAVVGTFYTAWTFWDIWDSKRRAN